MPRKLTLLEKNEQPINWSRAFIAGVFGCFSMMAFVDVFYLLGVTPFSFEQYVGSMFRVSAFGSHNWTVGLFFNGLVGGIFGFLYGYLFEYVFKRSGSWIGCQLGLAHAVFAAVAVLPFFGVIHEQLGTGVYPNFGFFGSGLGFATPLILFFAHILFGTTVGLFYGPVRHGRVRMRVFEPGETAIDPERGLISEEDDSRDRAAY